jgi:nucleotide sugar dehydrogenase
VGRDVLIGCAPRRDWFSSADNKSLRTIPRIFGGTDENTSKTMRSVLSIVCESLVPAPDHMHAEVVKSIENAYRHAEVALAFELSRAYPNLDMRTVLELVGTKWNVGTFFPSFGVGGYCIPLSSHYVMQGAEHPEELTLLEETVKVCEQQPRLVAQALVKSGVKKVGILGLSYTQNVKVWAQSPTLRISQFLREAGIQVKVNDPHYTDEEVKKIVGLETFEYPEGLAQFDAVLVVAAHREYRLADHTHLFQHLPNCRIILDNAGMWKDVDFRSVGIEYHVAGDARWMDGRVMPKAQAQPSNPLVASR